MRIVAVIAMGVAVPIELLRVPRPRHDGIGRDKGVKITRVIPLLVVFAYPKFVKASGDVARLLEQAAEARVQLLALETLIAMRTLGLFDVVVG